ncbi:hypothetical protein [Nonomuraea sp. NPDC049028]|uniref:hypothetical protein n=1 Tax=Nonomuraea sp. NPDC049028 TaxID=3364348 RepID=UPI003714E7F5
MSAPMEPEFMDPPPPASTQDEEWAHTIAVLIENTGKWARIIIGGYKDVGRLTGRIRKGRGGWAGHQWEVTTRNTGTPSAIHVYARHIKALNRLATESETDKEREQ